MDEVNVVIKSSHHTVHTHIPHIFKLTNPIYLHVHTRFICPMHLCAPSTVKGLEKEIRAARRELAPMQGDISDTVRTERSARLRAQVRGQHQAAVVVQRVYRGYRVREAVRWKANYWSEKLDDLTGEIYYYHKVCSARKDKSDRHIITPQSLSQPVLFSQLASLSVSQLISGGTSGDGRGDFGISGDDSDGSDEVI